MNITIKTMLIIAISLLIIGILIFIVPKYTSGAHKKKILIFTSCGGGGQTSITTALSESFAGSYDVIVNDIFTQTLVGLDFIAQLTNEKLTSVDIYNNLMKKKYLWRFSSLFYRLGNWRFGAQSKKASTLIQAYIQEKKPDLIISVVPIVNDAVLSACIQSDIPFLLFSADFDPHIYINNLTHADYAKFRLALPFIDETIQKQIAQVGIPESNVVITGYPLRYDFFSAKDLHAIKTEWHIPEDKPIILVTLGSLGSSTTPNIAQQLTHLSMPAHLILCVGKNKSLIPQIKKISLPAHITMSIVEFTKKIADLMAISNIIITKSGSTSFAESIYMHLPMILDGTGSILMWEKGNHRVLQENQLGSIITSYSQIPEKVTAYLQDKDTLIAIQNRMKALSNKNGINEITKLAADLLKGN